MIDAHIHFAGDAAETITMLETMGLKLLNVCVANGDWHRQIAQYTELARRHTTRYSWCTAFDLPDWSGPDAEYADRVIDGLSRDISDGAIAVKAWKNIGMELRAPDGRFVLIDDPVFDPIYRFLTREGVPMLMHIAEPLECWQPLREGSVHYGYYSKNPAWHMHNRPGFPSHGELIDARDHVLERHPGLRVVGAHLGSLEYDVAELARRFDRYPNFAADVSARLGDLMSQPSSAVRDFFLAYPDRLLFGTDIVSRKPHSTMADEELQTTLATTRVRYEAYTRYFESSEPVSFGGRRAMGIGLPSSVLDRLYAANARAWYPGM